MIKKWLHTDNLSRDNESRKIKQGLKIIRLLSKAETPLTIPIIAEEVKLSVPTVTRFVTDLKKQKLILEAGKIVTESGRKPIVYSLNDDKFYSIGVEILLNKLQVSIVNLKLQTRYTNSAQNFTLENTEKCREFICRFIQKTITDSGITTDNIIGIGIGITGRVNSSTGKTYNFFDFGDIPLASYISEQLHIPVIVENDTRIIGLNEFVTGKAKDLQNVLIVNIGSGAGMTLIANKTIIAGNSGFAGEFGHMQFPGNKNRPCICGKRGCLDTEVSGKALETLFQEDLEKGGHSTFANKQELSLSYNQIIEAANDGDLLPLTLLQKQGEKLGYALGNIINLLNPEVVIISGDYAKTGDYFSSSVQTALFKTGLKNPLADCKIINSELNKNSGCNGAAALIFKKHDLI